MSAILSRMRRSSLKQKLPNVFDSSKSDYVLLALLISLLVVNNAAWLSLDNSPPGWDAAGYLTNSLDALQAIQKPSLRTLASLYFQSLDPRPTFAFVALATPFYMLFGPTADVATLGTNSIFYALIVFGTYGIAKVLFDRRVGLLSAFVVSVNPELSELSTAYWPHFSVAAIAVAGTYLLLRSHRLESKKHTLGFGALLGIGLLMRPVYPALFLLGPTLFVAIVALFSNATVHDRQTVHHGWQELVINFRSRIVLGLAPALVIALCMAGPFYLRYSAGMLSKVSSQQDVTQRVLMAARQSPLWYLANMPHNMSWLFFALFIIGMTAAIVMLARGRRRYSLGFLLFWITSSYVLASLPLSKSFFYLAPLYCPIAIVSVFWICHLNRRVLRGVLIGTVLLIGVFTLLVASWGPLPVRQPAMQSLIETLGIPTHQPQPEDWRIEEIIVLLEAQESPSTPRRVGIVSDEYDFSWASFAYYSKLRAWDRDLDYSSAFDPWSTLLDTDYVVVKTGRWPSGARSAMQNARLLFQMLDNKGSVFYTTHELISEPSLPGGAEAQIYRRICPSSLQETLSICNELISLDPDNAAVYLTQLEESAAERQHAIALEPLSAAEYTALGDAYLRLGKFVEASDAFEQALRLDPNHAQAQSRREELGTMHNIAQRSIGDVIALLGYRTAPDNIEAEQSVSVTLWWQSLRPMVNDYTLFIHLVGPDGHIRAQDDRLLEREGLLTSAWEVGQLVTGQYQLEVPPGTPAGHYVVQAGVYYWKTGERLPMYDEHGERLSDDTIALGSITVGD
jgi:4-amino-4-deoxy-L-arabinose transferase-like glycosyltransferase/tetratricopeptide (TPR) repeat protein